MSILHNLPLLTSQADTNYLRRDADSGPNKDVTWSLGTPTMRWANIYSTNFVGTATTTLYADVAERFAANGPVVPGDVVCLMGDKEIALSERALDPNIMGVVSTNPAVCMNSDIGTDQTHPYIALSGRVPCKIIGTGKKGDRIVSSQHRGVGRVVTPEEFVCLSPFCVIGRLLADKLTETCELVEIIIGVK